MAQLDFADGAALRSPQMAAVTADAEALPAQRLMSTGEVTPG
ncbi:hypothetical protein [Streptomyces sp. 3N207]